MPRLSLSQTPEADGAGDAPQGGTPPPHQMNQDAAAMPPSQENGESAHTTAHGPQQPTNPIAASSRPATNNPLAASSAPAPPTTIAASSSPALPSSSAAAPSAPAPTTLATGQTGTPKLDDTISEATMVMIKEAAKNFVKEFGPKLKGKKKELKLPRFDASDLFAYFAKVAFNQAYGTNDVTDFPDELLSSGEDTTLPSVPSFNFMAQSPVAQHAESMSFSELERGYEEWQLGLHAALSSTLRSANPEVASSSAESNQSVTPEVGSSSPILIKDPQEQRQPTPTAPAKTANTSAVKSSESELTHEATESDHSRADKTNDTSKNTQQGPQPERSVDEPSKSPQQSPQQLQIDESEADESTNNICHANLPLYLQSLASNQPATNVAEPSEEPSRPSPRQQDPLPPNFGAGFGLPADHDNGDPTIMDVPQHAFEDGVANTPKSTQQNAKMWRPKAMEVVEEATEPTASTINTTTDSLLTTSNDSQEPSGSISNSSAQQNRSIKRKTTEEGDASDAKSPKKDQPIDFAMLEAALEPFRSTVPMNVDIAEGSYIIPPWFYADLDEFEFSNRAPAPPNSLVSSSSSSSSSESEDNGNAKVDERMEVDEAGSEGGEKSDERKAASEDGHDDSEAYFTAAEGDDEDSDADSDIGNDQSGDVDDESANQIAKKSEDEAKKGVSKPTKPNEASPKHGSSSSSSSSDSESDDDADGNANANANIAEPIEVIEIDSDAASQKSEGSKAETITISDSEGVSDDGINRTIEIGDESDVEMIQLSDDERMNESEGRHDVEEVVDTGTDANDQIEPSPSQAQVDSPPKNAQPSPKARTKSRLRQIFEDQQARKKAQEEAMARTKRRIRKQLMEKRAKQKARRARQYNRSPMKSRLRQLYEDGLKKAQLVQQQNAAVTSSDSSAAAPTTPEAPTSAPDAEEASTSPPANNEEMEIDRSHEAAESNEQPSVENVVAQPPSPPANSNQTPTEAAPVPEEVPQVRITGWVRPQHNGSSDEGSPDHRLLMMRRKFFMKEQDRKERLALKLKKKAEKSPLSSPKMRKSLAKLANSLKETMRRKLEAAKKAQRTEEGSQTPVPSASVLRQMLPDPAPSTVTRPTSSETATDQASRATSPDNQHIIGDNGSIQERLPTLYIGAVYPSSDSSSDSDSDEAVPIQEPARAPSPAPHVSPVVSPVLADIVDNETGSIANVPAPESTPEPVLPCRWPRCTSCHGEQGAEDIPPKEIVSEEQPTEETDGEVNGSEGGEGNASPNHIEPMGDGDFNDDPLLDQPMASPGSSQPPVNPDDDQMEVDPPSRPPTPRPLTPVSPGSNPDGHMCGSHCRCPRLYGPPRNRRQARPAPYRPPRRNQEGRAPRQRQTDPQFGRLRHVRNLTGANLPDAPPVVVNQRRVITGSRLEEAMQMQVVNGDNYQAALYHPGVVVFRGHFNGGSRAAALIRQAEEQPVTLFHQPNDPAISIAGGPNHLVILTRSGHVHTIGRATEGQLGIGDPTRHRQSSVTPHAMLRRVFEGDDHDEVIFRRIRTEGNVSVAITLTGRKFKCGEGYGTVFQETDDPMDTDDEGDDE